VREVMGVMLLGEANREAPAQAELSPSCAGGLLRQPAPSLKLLPLSDFFLIYASLVVRFGIANAVVPR
jgi:hypothetical protein